MDDDLIGHRHPGTLATHKVVQPRINAA